MRGIIVYLDHEGTPHVSIHRSLNDLREAYQVLWDFPKKMVWPDDYLTRQEVEIAVLMAMETLRKEYNDNNNN